MQQPARAKSQRAAARSDHACSDGCVAAAGGCILGSAVTAQLVHGQAKPPGPLDGKLSHIAFAVTDVDKTVKAFADVFGAPAPPIREYRDIPWGPEYPTKVMNGRIASLVVNGVSFEFIQPLDGDSPWKDFIKKSGDGIHHIGFEVKDVPAARKALQAKGGHWTQFYANWANYVDMHDAGVPATFEVTSAPAPGEKLSPPAKLSDVPTAK